MEFDLTKTVALLVALVALGTAGLIGGRMMRTNIVLMMVTPSMLVFGAICLALGVKHGEYRAAN
ncbi:hypothetical protein C440_15214 [Haloferax mucosum ATCC BAA-1512]|uniref:Uncharacterized protein n=1 Tax=Haloferax mucosum ATCC BAA-1512 TaxID=662479 RepID=M0I4H0_9EURY|nr:hypothetical protein [Haloferax mucosum]ELZ91675.1 hypothetical protein C440_15214 [Haloferax mucosum ATCC BAA-1512]